MVAFWWSVVCAPSILTPTGEGIESMTQQSSIMRGTSELQALGGNIKNQDVLNINPTGSSREASIHLYESIQSAEIMATGFHENLPKVSIQTRKEI
jgi:hypothetical protein